MAAPGTRLSRWAVTSCVGLLLFTGVPTLLLAAGDGESSDRLVAMLQGGPGVSNHPVRVVPSARINIPKGWPLADDGSITCLTCHAELPSLRGAVEPQLRGFERESDGASAFCARCHSEDATPTAPGMHWLALGKAHIASDNSRGERYARVLDADTRTCLGCHDGVSAGEAKNTVAGNSGISDFGNQTGNHPVGVRYSRRSARGRGSSLRPASMLPDEVRLPGGMVSCVSCHDLYAPDQYYLTVPLDESKLCFTCHELD